MKSFLFFLLFSAVLYGQNWKDNRVDYDLLCEYIGNPVFAQKIHSLLLFIPEIEASTKLAINLNHDRAQVLPYTNYYIKKRLYDNVNDLYAYELSSILNASNVPAAVACTIASHRCILQESILMHVGVYNKPLPFKILSSVPLEEYWRAILLSYVLGLCDLHEGNVGISLQGEVIYFDNDGLRFYTNKLHRSSTGIRSFFITSLMDWPQYEAAVDEKLAEDLKDLLLFWKSCGDRIRQYGTIRSLDKGYIQSILSRIEIALSFPFQMGATFRQFYAFLFPQIAIGLDDLSARVSGLLKERVGHGRALYWYIKRQESKTIPPEIVSWLTQYFPL